jgi:hypothetical protein
MTLPTASLADAPLHSTAGVTYEQANDGVNLSVPTNQATRSILNVDESTYQMGTVSHGLYFYIHFPTQSVPAGYLRDPIRRVSAGWARAGFGKDGKCTSALT